MRATTKIVALSLILALDLIFFLVLRVYLPQLFNLIFHMMPWSDDLEKFILIIVGMAVAVVCSLGIAHILLKRLGESLAD